MQQNIQRLTFIFSLAYTALPLVLLSLDVKLSSTESQKLTRKYQLNLYAEMMKHYGRRYNFVNVVSDTVGKLLQLVDQTKSQSSYLSLQENSSDLTSSHMLEASRPNTWGDIVLQQPQLYFRLSASLDYSLSRGKYPRDSELPSWVVGSYPPTVQLELVVPAEIAVTATNPPVPVNPQTSLMRNEPLDTSQACHLDEVMSVSSNNAIPDAYCNGSATLGHDMFELGASIGMNFSCSSLDNDYERNEATDTNQFPFSMFSNFSDTTSVSLD